MIEDEDRFFREDNDLFGRREAHDPKKAVLLAIVLMLCGTALLTLGTFIYLGKVDIGGKNQVGHGSYPFLIVGGLTFIPGFYHVRIAYYAWYKTEGFDFNEIPEM